MCNGRRRRGYWLNNMVNNEKNKYETLCNNIPNGNDNSYNSNCSCGFEEDDDGFPTNPMYAQSYVPVQEMNNTYMPCSGIEKGTIFPELVSEYYPCQNMAEIQYIMDANVIKEGCNR